MKKFRNKLWIFLFFSFLLSGCYKNDEFEKLENSIISPANLHWTSHEMPQNWTPRDGACFLVFKDYLYLIGGWGYDVPYSGGRLLSEVWRTFDGLVWERLPDAPWTGRHGFGICEFKNKVYIVGGDLQSDCWVTDNFYQWELLGNNLPFGKVYTPNLVALDNYMLLYGGLKWENDYSGKVIPSNSVFKSVDGFTWEELPKAPWLGRGLIHGIPKVGNKVFIIGGGTKQEGETMDQMSDVWSTSDGLKWLKESDSLPIPSRTHFSTIYSSGYFWISDGSINKQINVSNDLYITKDFISVTKLQVPLDLRKRHASSFIEFKNKLFLLGGPPTDLPNKTYWILD